MERKWFKDLSLFLLASPDELSKEKEKYPYKGAVTSSTEKERDPGHSLRIANERDGSGKQLAQGLDNEIHHYMARSMCWDVNLAESRIT